MLAHQNNQSRVAVIGGGISGIATAFYLLQSGYMVDLFEASGQLGGRIGVASFQDKMVSFGGKNIGRKYHEMRAFVEAISGEPNYEDFGINTSQIKSAPNGQENLQHYDSRSPLSMLSTLRQNLSINDALKLSYLAGQHLINKSLGDCSNNFYNRLASKKKFPTLSDYFSQKAQASIIRAATVRMNAAEPDEIFLQTFGSNLHMILDQYDQLSEGFDDVFSKFEQKFCESLTIHFNTKVSSVELGTPIGITTSHQGVTSRLYYRQVIVTLPANQACTLFAATDDASAYSSRSAAISSLLDSVRYYPVGVVLAKYDQPIFTARRRASLIPAPNPVSNVGAYGINDLDLARYTLSGRYARGLLGLPQDEWLVACENAARQAGLLKDQKLMFWQAHQFSAGLCGYAVRQDQFLNQLNALLQKAQGLYLTGDYIKGASLENCFRSAKAVVQQVRNNSYEHSDARRLSVAAKFSNAS